MKSKMFCGLLVALILGLAGCSGVAIEKGSHDSLIAELGREFDLGGERTSEERLYVVETLLYHFAPDGTRTRIDSFRLELEFLPGAADDTGGGRYRCRRFSVQSGTDAPLSIPALEGWTYSLDTDFDEEGQIFGLDHSKFENLKAENDKPLGPDGSYFVYNTFVDFHAFCDVFARKTFEGKGIQDLRKTGDRIIHAAAHTEPPVNLGGNIAEGSTFKNGEVTLEFKGVALVDGKACSLVGFDSGESSFRMIMRPTPEMEILTIGRSHYFGDLYIDLKSHWVEKVDMKEVVVSETSLPMPPHKVNGIIERATTIRAVDKDGAV